MKKTYLVFILLFIRINNICSIEGWSVDRVLVSGEPKCWMGDMAANGNVIHVVYSATLTGTMEGYEIFYMKSNDGGDTWGPQVRLTNSYGDSGGVVIEVSGSDVHVAWEDSREGGKTYIYYKHSLDGGNTWSEDKKIPTSYDLLGVGRGDLAIAAENNNVYIVCQEFMDPDMDIYFFKSTDRGNTFSPEVRLTNDPNVSAFPVLVAKNGYVHVFWHDGRDGPSEIYYKRSLDNGNTWGPDIRLTNSGKHSERPKVAIDRYGNIHLVYFTRVIGTYVNDELWYTKSFDNGTTWQSPVLLTKLSGVVVGGECAVKKDSKDNICIIFDDAGKVDDTLNVELFFKSSSDNGNTWSENIRLTYNIGDSYISGMSVTDKGVNIIWYDTSTSPPQIRYKRRSVIDGAFSEESKSYLEIYPNPCSLSEGKKVKILYKSPSFSNESFPLYMKIYTISGELVKTLINGEEKPTGWVYNTEWDGKNDLGELVARGLYLIHYYSPVVGSRDSFIRESFDVNEVKKLVIK
jgi:hypothetical protein